MVFNYTILLYTGNNLCSKYALGKKSRIASTAACMQPSNYIMNVLECFTTPAIQLLRSLNYNRGCNFLFWLATYYSCCFSIFTLSTSSFHFEPNHPTSNVNTD